MGETSRQEESPEEGGDIEKINDRIKELIRKEQGWNVQKQAKTEAGGLSDEEREELKNLSAQFNELGGMDKLRELQGQGE